MSEDLPRRYEARYASSAEDEVSRNVVFAPGEVICHSQWVSERKSWLIARPRFLALTPLRMLLVEHYALEADWILEIPCAALGLVSLEKGLFGGWVNFIYSDSGETRTIQIKPLSRGIYNEAANRKLFDVLNAFRQGQLNSLG